MRILLFIVAISLIGCSAKVAPTLTTKTVIKDSIIVKEVVRHDTVKIKGEKITTTQFINCDSASHKIKPFDFKEKKNQATLEVKVDEDGKLTATASCDSLNKVIEIKDKEISRLHSERNDKAETKVVINHEPYWYDIMCRWIAGIVLLIVIAFVIYSYIKLKTKIVTP